MKKIILERMGEILCAGKVYISHFRAWKSGVSVLLALHFSFFFFPFIVGLKCQNFGEVFVVNPGTILVYQ